MKVSKAQQRQETMAKLLEIAREHFSTQGYAHAATEDMVKEAGLTRGALYHHFGNKEGLFRAVLESVQKEIAEQVETEAAKSQDPWEQLLNGCLAFVTSAVEHRNRRILLIDGPSVLGWEAWRKMDEEHSMQLLQAQLQSMAEQGYLAAVPIEALTHLLSGAMNEAALWIALMPDQAHSLEQMTKAMTLMLEGYRVK
ncbi:transcriptional regulator [Brevibacillus parabrevis]|uniref:TetR/AcrR family transcriptional regulator n=1 Tax=Brevibacillus parabrevis TaxID=54914 RepID=UPI0007AB8468|nr:TetR/AcrR family transcriptional regulator [Brevibacillus parabrevis]KZE52816.1 transcriptional regulator [Brevibacillus parabrevis]